MKIKSPMKMLSQMVAAVMIPVGVVHVIASVVGSSAFDGEMGSAAAFLSAYVGAAVYLLAHYPMLIMRLRVGLFLSLMSLAGIGAALLIMPTGRDQFDGLLALLVYAAGASLPLIVIGAHNLSWSLKRIQQNRVAR